MPRTRRPFHRLRSTLMVLLTGTLLGVAGCVSGSSAPPPCCAEQARDAFVISYAGADGRLDGMDQLEAREQLRDWAQLGLASRLELDTPKLRDALYDAVPVRDKGFADLARQPAGSGRALFDGAVLHVLVPRGDPHASRTIGLQIDQFRTDSGSDAPRTQLHQYEIKPDTRTIELINGEPTSTSDLRASNGYFTMRVNDAKELADFLARNRQLSSLEVRGSEVWAGGWTWPDDSGAALDSEDVSVIQRGYLHADTAGLPAFSLDPGPVRTPEDLRAALPGVRPELIDRISANNWQGSGFASAAELADLVERALHDELPADEQTRRALPTDRTQLWGLLAALTGQPVYSEARYDGMLKGTKVGMSLFYTDYVAKNWTNGVGTGGPAGKVEGFTPDSDAPTAWSHCDPAGGPRAESGRLWFGQADTAFDVQRDRVSIGAQATRLFSRSNGDGGTEVEPSFAFGRGLTWWDRHYEAVAGYELQYRRLEQIMRWSGALEWLTTKTSARLPQLADGAIRSDLRFADWFAHNTELREHDKIEFVSPPSAKNEALLHKPSKSYESCGFSWISGGVSLGNAIARAGGKNFRAELPPPIRRAGPKDPGSAFNTSTGGGHLADVSVAGGGKVAGRVERTVSTSDSGGAVVETTTGGSVAASFQDLKVLGAQTQRAMRTVISGVHGTIRHSVQYLGQQLGSVVAHLRSRGQVTIQWEPGSFYHAQDLFGEVQRRLASRTTPEVPPGHDAIQVARAAPDGSPLYQVGGNWFSFKSEKTPGTSPAFELVDPGPPGGTPTAVYVTPVARPASGPWLAITPRVGDHPALLDSVDAPTAASREISVLAMDGRRTTVRWDDRRAFAARDDPILGEQGTGVGKVLLRDMGRVSEVLRDAGDRPEYRAVPLGRDGVALVRHDGVIIVENTHRWYDVASRGGDAPSEALFRVDGDELRIVSDIDSTVRQTSEETSLGSVWQATGDPRNAVYAQRGAYDSMSLERGAFIPNTFPHERKMRLIRVQAQNLSTAQAGSMRSRPDILRYRNIDWFRVDSSSRFGGWNIGGAGGGNSGAGGTGGNGGGNGQGGTGSTSSSSTPPPSGANGAGAQPTVGQIIFVCPENSEQLAGCGA